ncbi:TetR/AcrR family transcriptional regulator [Natrinema versiforme]|uniref:TetR family transcriptional regulator n=1 Tax=Natrinema versiforme JCM 10478 TaxID=1227496 RepID=L9XPA7_9EURY|nr:helix-turn-helix domain-containing protein [Natrinema versiforme]ELY63266.1 TetR family transcriptional regulator [Natrinema versiforme JCM 10478]
MDDPTTAILNTAYQALCTHGSAALTVRDIAAESSMSKASNHYHYVGKDDPFVALLDSIETDLLAEPAAEGRQ